MKKTILLSFLLLASISLIGCTKEINNNKNMTNNTNSNEELSDNDLLDYVNSDFDKEKMMNKEIIIGQHNGIPVRASFPCADMCPDRTTKVVSYDLEISECQKKGGVVKSTSTPSLSGTSSIELCFPKIIVENNIYLFFNTRTSQYNYGEIITYEKDKALEFPDFSIKYTGERKEEVPQYAQGYFIYYDFEISTDNKSDIVSWSSGTGSIGPKYFNFNNQDYVLEKGASILQEKVLQNDEIVIWEKEEFENNKDANSKHQ